MLKFPISKLGPKQTLDVERSGEEIHDAYFRTCTILQPTGSLDRFASSIGDTSPIRISYTYGQDALHWNEHFIVQVAGCPLSCWYCYVDNLHPDDWLSCEDLVRQYTHYKLSRPGIHVFHLMGGCPGAYAYLWPELRACMDEGGFSDDILLTNVILVEHLIYGVRPWVHIPPRTLVNICIKGTSRDNFYLNTHKPLYRESLIELAHYRHPAVYFSMIEFGSLDVGKFTSMLGVKNIDFLHVKQYEATASKRKR